MAVLSWTALGILLSILIRVRLEMPIQQPILLAFLVILSNLSLFIDIASLDFLRLILVDLLVVLSNFVLYLLEDAII